MRLNTQQQILIENSLWIVNTVLKKQGLAQSEDLRQSAIMYMCECLTRFNPGKGVKWSTYAYRNLFLYTKKMSGKEYAKRRNEQTDENLLNLCEKAQGFETQEIARIEVSAIMEICNPFEKQVLTLKMQGYTLKEISRQLNCSLSKINSIIHNIKEKVRR